VLGGRSHVAAVQRHGTDSENDMACQRTAVRVAMGGAGSGDGRAESTTEDGSEPGHPAPMLTLTDARTTMAPPATGPASGGAPHPGPMRLDATYFLVGGRISFASLGIACLAAAGVGCALILVRERLLA